MDKQITRTTLKQAAAELFAEYGFDGTTTEMIARRAGVNKALINYYYRSKKELHLEIVETMLSSLREPLEGLKNLNLPPDEQLRRFIEIFADRHKVYPMLSTMLLRELLSGGEQISERCLPHFLFMMKYVADLLARGIRERVFRPVDPFLTHLSLIGTLVFFFATMKARDHLIRSGIPVTPPTADQYLPHIAELFLRGLKPDPEKP
ncbi:MAG: TetR/AcrR family transcriptional regulator [Pseudomonadota bacterium]